MKSEHPPRGHAVPTPRDLQRLLDHALTHDAGRLRVRLRGLERKHAATPDAWHKLAHDIAASVAHREARAALVPPITLDESLNAAEYLASEGNRKVVFGLRGMKTNMGDPHRNFVDFSHVPVVKRLTRMPVCIDPSHSVGMRAASPDGILDIMHATAQGVVAGANMVLVDFHPAPGKALVDGPQALLIRELPLFLEDVRIAREAYEQRAALAGRYHESPA